MPGITVAIDLPASPDEVWELLADISTHVEWMADARAIRFTTAQRSGVGTRFLCDTQVGPLRLVDQMSVTSWEPGRVMGVAHEGIVAGSGRFTLDPLDGARRTRFTWSEQLRFPWYLGGPLGAAIAGWLVLGPLWRGNLRRLARMVAAAQGDKPAGVDVKALARQR